MKTEDYQALYEQAFRRSPTDNECQHLAGLHVVTGSIRWSAIPTQEPETINIEVAFLDSSLNKAIRRLKRFDKQLEVVEPIYYQLEPVAALGFEVMGAQLQFFPQGERLFFELRIQKPDGQWLPVPLTSMELS